MQTKTKKEPSEKLLKELTILHNEIKSSMSKFRELYQKVDQMALEEGFTDGEIYEVTYDMFKELDNNNNNDNDNNTATANINNNKTYPYFQYFK